MEKIPTLLFVFGARVVNIVNGQPPYTSLSENTHMFLIAQEALRLGWRVYFKMMHDNDCPEIKAIYPTVHYNTAVNFDDQSFQPDMMFFVNYPVYIVETRYKKPNAIGVFILNAHYWLEGPEGFGLNTVELWRQGLGNDVDFILTQNPRMADIGYKLFNITAKWAWRDRFLIAPNTYTPEALAEENTCFSRGQVRAEMGLTENDIAIINSGGPWTWTDAETFYQAFARAVALGATRLKFFQMGLRQLQNLSQAPAEEFVRLFIIQNYDLVTSGHLIVEDDWRRASDCLPKYNYGADIGLNVSKESAENYQAHRVRFIDYAKAGLPVLQTMGSYYGDVSAHKAVISVEPGNVDNYVDALMKINNGEIDLTAKRIAMHDFAESIVSSKVIPGPLQSMLRAGRLSAMEREQMRLQLYYVYRAVRDDDFENRFTPENPGLMANADWFFEKCRIRKIALAASKEIISANYYFPINDAITAWATSRGA